MDKIRERIAKIEYEFNNKGTAHFIWEALPEHHQKKYLELADQILLFLKEERYVQLPEKLDNLLDIDPGKDLFKERR